MENVKRLLEGLERSGVIGGLAGGLAGGALVSAATSKRGRKLGRTALKVGALAAVGGVAWKAYQAYSDNRRADSPKTSAAGGAIAAPAAAVTRVQPGAPAAGAPADPGYAGLDESRFAAVIDESPANPGPMLLLRAMIAAAHADGHIDSAENARIHARVRELPLTDREKARLFDELAHPPSLRELVVRAERPEIAIEVYAASLLAVDPVQPAARDYLARLALVLELPSELIEQLHRQAALRDDAQVNQKADAGQSPPALLAG
ncbi:MAG: tellurite resistance TerB family protein [Pseudomonadales bacterium]